MAEFELTVEEQRAIRQRRREQRANLVSVIGSHLDLNEKFIGGATLGVTLTVAEWRLILEAMEEFDG